MSATIQRERTYLSSGSGIVSIFRVGNKNLLQILHQRFSVNYIFCYSVFILILWTNYQLLETAEDVLDSQRVLLLVATVPSSILAICVLASFEGLLERDAVLAVKVTARCGLAFMVAWVYADLLLFRLMAIHLSVGIRRLGDGGFKQLMLNVVGLGINNRQMWL